MNRIIRENQGVADKAYEDYLAACKQAKATYWNVFGGMVNEVAYRKAIAAAEVAYRKATQ